MKSYLFVIVILGFTSCQEASRDSFSDLNVTTTGGESINLGAAVAENNVVLIFLSPDCPLCINYTKTITDLSVKYHNRPVKFIPVYAGPYYSGNEISKFQKDYNFEIPGILDPDFRIVKIVDATMTPEAVLLSTQGEIKYSGAIDNWMYETGKKRQVITESYLDTAITQLLRGINPSPGKTQPVGCFIEK